MRRAGVIPRSVLAVAAVVALLGVASGCGAKQSAKPAATTAAPGATTVAPTTTTTTAPATPPTTAPAVASLPLFPFADLTEVAAWQDAYRTGGAQPWHLDAGETALAFTRFLGDTDVDRVVSQHADGTGSHVAVGFRTEGVGTGTAAIVHLIRYGSGTDVPWEVVGTDDTTFSITTPAYGSVVTSPVHVGGVISGVDESIKVDVTQLHSNGHIGETCCVPAGGMDAPWHATVSFSTPRDRVLIVSASTGGHVRTSERFTVTAVRAG